MLTNTPIAQLGRQFAPAWHRPWLRYIDPVDGAEGGTPKPPEDLGFPRDTPVKDMTPEQQAAYWHNQSKVQQSKYEQAERDRKAYEKFGTVDDLQAAADAAEQQRREGLDVNQKAIEDARAAAKAEAQREAAGKHLPVAVTSMLVALTKNVTESFEDAQKRIAGAIEFADLTKFVGDDGNLDAEKVQTFAKSIGSVAGDGGSEAQQFGAAFASFQQGNVQPAPGASGSIAAMEQAAYDQMTKNNA